MWFKIKRNGNGTDYTSAGLPGNRLPSADSLQQAWQQTGSGQLRASQPRQIGTSEEVEIKGALVRHCRRLRRVRFKYFNIH